MRRNIHRKLLVTVFAGSALAALASGANAADMPVKAPPRAVVEQTGSWYVWVDGSYQSISLPRYELGWRRTAPVGTSFDTGVPLQGYDPRAHGAGVAGAIGHRFSNWTMFGSAVRVELGASYVKADVSENNPTLDQPRSALPLLDGRVIYPCGVGTCTYTSALSTDYKAWQVNLKTSTDHKFGNVTVTPSVALFGGRATNDQHLRQTQTVGTTATYDAQTRLAWDDFGGKFGLAAMIDVTPQVAFGVSGNVGFAGRDVSFSGTDIPINLAQAFRAPSNVSASTDTTAFLANAEASLTIRPSSGIALRAFGGLNYDSKVPGIAKPSWTGDSGGPTSTTPAGIRFERETSWYAGGGIVVSFGGPVVAR